MKNTLLLLIALVLGFSPVWAQQFFIPKYDSIEVQLETDSSLAWPVLWERFQAGDTSLSLQQRHFIYYGYTLQPEYSPMGRSDYGDSLKPILSKDDLDSIDLSAIIHLTQEALQEEPFNLNFLSYQIYAAGELQDYDSYNNALARANVVLDAILTSGDGKTPETCFYVIKVSHEYALLNVLGFEFGGEQSVTGTVDYLKVAKNPEYIEGLYFDVSPSFMWMKGMFEDDEDD